MDRALIWPVLIRVRPFIWAAHRLDKIVLPQLQICQRHQHQPFRQIPVQLANYPVAYAVQLADEATANHRKIHHHLAQKNSSTERNHKQQLIIRQRQQLKQQKHHHQRQKQQKPNQQQLEQQHRPRRGKFFKFLFSVSCEFEISNQILLSNIIFNHQQETATQICQLKTRIKFNFSEKKHENSLLRFS